MHRTPYSGKVSQLEERIILQKSNKVDEQVSDEFASGTIIRSKL
jgi:hypothetical protein